MFSHLIREEMTMFQVLRKEKIALDMGFLYVFALWYGFFFCNLGTWPVKILVMIIGYWIGSRRDLRVEIALGHVLLSIAFVSMYVLLSLPNLRNSVNGDHWYHIQSAYEKILAIVYAEQGALHTYAVRDILQFASAIMLVLTLAAHQLYKSRPYWSISLLLGLGIYLYNSYPVAGYVDPHPVLRGLPVLFSGVAGVDSFGFRIQGFLAIFCLVLWLSLRVWPLKQKLLLIVFSLSIPLVYFTAPLVEFSIWACVMLTVFFIRIVDEEELTDRDLVVFGMSFVMAGMIRQTMLFGFATLLLYCFLQKRYKSLCQCLLIGVPVYFQIFNARHLINPAAYVPDEKFLNVPTHLGLLERVLYSMQPVNLQAVLASTGLSLLGLVLIGFIILGVKERYRIAAVLALAAVFSWVLFHAIRPILWGVPRYQSEYIVPLSLAGATLLLREFKKAGGLCLAALALFNVVLIVQFYDVMPSRVPDYPEWSSGKTPYLSELPFNVDEALKKTFDGCGDSVYFDGTTYGNFPVIFAGVSLHRYLKISQVRPEEARCVYHLYPQHISGGFFNAQRNSTVVLEKR
jgi:hypothetical protein